MCEMLFKIFDIGQNKIVKCAINGETKCSHFTEIPEMSVVVQDPLTPFFILFLFVFFFFLFSVVHSFFLFYLSFFFSSTFFFVEHSINCEGAFV